jgi:hypothetical protein
MADLLAIFAVFFVPLALAIVGQRLFLGGAMDVLNLPVMSGRRWVVTSPLMTLVRCGDEWRYNLPISMGSVLEFCGWAGVHRDEPMASFMSPDLPDWIVFIPYPKLGQWCREIGPAPIKVRIVDDCAGDK